MSRTRSAALFALRLLRHERGRLVASIGGITFTLLLMLIQLGFRDALLDSSVELLRKLDADILVLDKEKHPFMRRVGMELTRMYSTLGAEGVASAYPVWIHVSAWKNLETGTRHPVRIIGIRPDDRPIMIDEVIAHQHRLLERNVALADHRARDTLGPIRVGRAEVSREVLHIAGTFPLGTDFEVDGTIIVSDETFGRLGRRADRHMEVALVQVEEGHRIEDVVKNIRAILPGDVIVVTKAETLEKDLEYWRNGTPISLILLIGVLLGFVVGVVICYQILYTDVLDHLSEFATLKAIGYGDRYIQTVVLVEALVLSLIGLVPAIAIGWGLMRLLYHASGLPAGLGADDALAVGALSVSMCVVSGLFALRKVSQLDPAELF